MDAGVHCSINVTHLLHCFHYPEDACNFNEFDYNRVAHTWFDDAHKTMSSEEFCKLTEAEVELIVCAIPNFVDRAVLRVLIKKAFRKGYFTHYFLFPLLLLICSSVLVRTNMVVLFSQLGGNLVAEDA